MTHTIAAGIDVGQKFTDVGFAPSGAALRLENAPAGIAWLIEKLTLEGVKRVVLQAIGPYAQ